VSPHCQSRDRRDAEQRDGRSEVFAVRRRNRAKASSAPIPSSHAHAARVEAGEREPAGIGFVADQARGQEPRDDEEHVDADDATRKGTDARVKKRDGNDRDRPEPVNVGTVVVHPARAGPTRASPDPCAGRQRQIRGS
jgi:hypothetical protein